ncbi:MAG: hypothetical protein WCW77_05725 [Patescibacteria group bacterium]|jgi:hypothetical protein
MFETSRDILNIVLAVSIGAVAFFICWFMFYLVMSFRNVYKVTREIRETLGEVKNTVLAFKDKVKEAAAFFVMATDGFKRVMDYIKDKGEKKEKKKKGGKGDEE